VSLANPTPNYWPKQKKARALAGLLLDVDDDSGCFRLNVGLGERDIEVRGQAPGLKCRGVAAECGHAAFQGPRYELWGQMVRFSLKKVVGQRRPLAAISGRFLIHMFDS
jgi:hypothetical protein